MLSPMTMKISTSNKLYLLVGWMFLPYILICNICPYIMAVAHGKTCTNIEDQLIKLK